MLRPACRAARWLVQLAFAAEAVGARGRSSSLPAEARKPGASRLRVRCSMSRRPVCACFSVGPKAAGLAGYHQSAEAGWWREVSSRRITEVTVPRGCQASVAEARSPPPRRPVAMSGRFGGAEDWTVSLPTHEACRAWLLREHPGSGPCGPVGRGGGSPTRDTGGASRATEVACVASDRSVVQLACLAEAGRACWSPGAVRRAPAEAGARCPGAGSSRCAGAGCRRSVRAWCRLRPVGLAEASPLGAAPSRLRPPGRSPLELLGGSSRLAC